MLTLLAPAYAAAGVVLLCMSAVRVVVWSPVIRTNWTGQVACGQGCCASEAHCRAPLASAPLPVVRAALAAV